MEKIRRWKEDVLGPFFEMKVGGREDWGIDWSGWISASAGDALATATWTVPGAITKVSQQENGNQAKVTLDTQTAGTFWCSHLVTTNLGLKRPFFFRVIVKNG